MTQILEIERKFIVVSPPSNLEGYPHEEIWQGYVAADPNGTVVRLRRKGDHFFETVKSKGLRARLEIEVALTREQFDALWPATEGRRLRKIRYEIPDHGYTIELDRYLGPLEGFFTAEVEFPSHEEAAAYEPPSWFGREVTMDPRYKNLSLATVGLPQDAPRQTDGGA